MTFNFNGVKVAYRFEGEGETCLLCLHGWGCDSHIFDKFLNLFSGKKLVLIDFPPFGESNIEPKGWNIFTYANMIISFCQCNNLAKVHVLGHSFGGRIAILLCAMRPDIFESSILLDSAGLKPKRGLKYYSKIYSYKLARKMGFMFNKAGSSDYQNLSDNMKEVFKSIVNEPLDEYLPLIKQKILIIFGKNDKETPIYMAKRLHNNIKNSRLEILDEAGHFSFLDQPLTCFRLIDKFLEE